MWKTDESQQKVQKLQEIAEFWLEQNKLNKDNYNISILDIEAPQLTTTVYKYVFVHNKAFAKYFFNDSPLAERIHYSDFVVHTAGYFNMTIEKDTKNKLTNSYDTLEGLKNSIIKSLDKTSYNYYCDPTE
jgi:hypothetical protein